MAETNSAQSHNAQIAAQTALYQAQTEYQKAMTNLTDNLNLGEDIKQKLNSQNVEQNEELLKQLRVQGKISESDYGKALTYLDRFTKSISPFLSLIPWFNSGKKVDHYLHKPAP